MMSSRDPRQPKGVTWRYNRDEVITTITSFYELLAKLPYIEPTDVLYPPAGGWPNITKENFACLGRSDGVIELLKRLPYIKMSHNFEYLIAPQTHPCDYRRDYFQSPAFTESNSPWDIPCGLEYPPWVVPVTYGKNNGSYLMLDTTDGTVTDYRVTGGGFPPDYKDKDPRSWRNECEDRTRKLTDVINEWKENFQSLAWIGLTVGLPEICFVYDSSDTKKTRDFMEIQEIIHTHGWPDDFNRQGCKQTLEDWNERCT